MSENVVRSSESNSDDGGAVFRDCEHLESFPHLRLNWVDRDEPGAVDGVNLDAVEIHCQNCATAVWMLLPPNTDDVRALTDGANHVLVAFFSRHRQCTYQGYGADARKFMYAISVSQAFDAAVTALRGLK